MIQYTISDSEFTLFRDFIYKQAGISLSAGKKTLVTSRLSKRLRHYSLESFQQYFDLIMSPAHPDEIQTTIDLLTTNETYFFRETKHFDFLEQSFLPKWKPGKTLRIWSAASSTGEEAYSIAMVLQDKLGTRPWEIFGSDINYQVLTTARRGHYSLARIDGIPNNYLKSYCLKGIGEQKGTLLVTKELRDKITFEPVNLTKPLRDVGLFDIIFLRNVLIYFDTETKKKIIKQLADKLAPKGYLIVGHSESLKDIHDGLETVIPTVYQWRQK